MVMGAPARREPEAKAIVLDDDVSFLNRLKQREHESRVEFFTTTDPMECLQWVEQGLAPTLVSDLKLDNHPDWDGLDVLARARAVRPEAELKLLTGFDLTAVQRRRATSIKAHVYRKSDGTSQLFEDILAIRASAPADDFPPLPTGIAAELAQKRRLYALLVGDLVDELSRIPEPQTRRIVRGDVSFTVADLIRELKAGEGPHVERYVDLWVKAKKQLRDMGRNP
jgi:CheY-like chemotaxis protein